MESEAGTETMRLEVCVRLYDGLPEVADIAMVVADVIEGYLGNTEDGDAIVI